MSAMTLKSRLRELAPRRVRAHRILGGPLKGRVIVTSLHDYPGAVLGRTEGPLLEWFRTNIAPGETWLDVGAHYGYTAIAMAESTGPRGLIYAFEPTLDTAASVVKTIALNHLNNVSVVPLALGSPGRLRIETVAVDRGMANHAFGGSASGQIFVVAFDEFWEAIGRRPIHGAKIDVQGMELDVLRGMTGMLSEHHPKLVIEFHAGVDRDEILDLLRGAGYEFPGAAVDPAPDEATPAYRDDHSYAFKARTD